MPLFDIPVFIAAANLCSLALQTVMSQQSGVPIRELLQIVHVVDRR